MPSEDNTSKIRVSKDERLVLLCEWLASAEGKEAARVARQGPYHEAPERAKRYAEARDKYYGKRGSKR